MKERLDVLLVKRNLAESREKAKAIIMSGIVYVDGQKEDKAGTAFEDTVSIEVRGNTLKYVSRGGLKLEKAMTHFGLTLDGKICMDVGSSTGGFTDCDAAERGSQGICSRRGPWTAGMEAAQRRAGSLHGKDQYPLRNQGRYSGSH